MVTKKNSSDDVSGWVGWIYFAAFIMVFVGIFQMIMGLVALVNKTFYVVHAQSQTLVAFDITTWGWIHLLLGILVLSTGIALFSGSTWARIVAIVLVAANFISQFAFIGVYPFWSITMLILDLVVIYALTVHGGEAKVEE